MRTSARLNGTLATVVLLLVTATGGRADDMYEMGSAFSPRVRAAERLSAADPNERLSMSLTLQLQHREELDALIAEQRQPGSAAYHRWLSPEEFTRRFSPPIESYDAIVEWLRRQGVTVQTWPHRLRIDFSGAVHQAEGMFHVRTNRYRHRNRPALANDRAPVIPARFAGVVASLRLNTFRFAEPLVLVPAGRSVKMAMGPHDISTANADRDPHGKPGRGIDSDTD